MKAIKYLWILSLLFYLGIALFIYADVDGVVNLHFDSSGVADYALKKQTFFYYSLAAVIAVNGIILLLAHAMPYINMPFRERWMEDKLTKRAFLSNLKEWTRGFALFANIFFMVVQGAVYAINSTVHTFSVPFFTYLVGTLTLGWIIAYFPIFRKPTVTS